MNKVTVFVNAKTLTPIECVKLVPAQTYNDTIVKNTNYIDVNQKSIQVVNLCSQSFTIAETVLFTDTASGGDFSAKLKSFTIGANQTLNIPVYYNGMYKGSNLTPSYTIILNSVQNIYNLVVTVPVINNPPVVSDIVVALNNRQSYTMTLAEFLAHFTDLDGDTLSSVFIFGDVSLYRLSGSAITSGQEITKAQINSGLLTKLPPNIDSYTENVTVWKAKDSAGSISV